MTDDSTIDDVIRRAARTLADISPAGSSPPWETFADVAPALGRQTAFAFGTVLSRPGLDLRTRELLTVAMIATLGGAEAQLAFHLGGALRAGVTPAELAEVLAQVGVYAGLPRALNAATTARAVFADLNADPSHPAPREVALDFLTAEALAEIAPGLAVDRVLAHGQTVLVQAAADEPASRVIIELTIDGDQVTAQRIYR